MKKLNQIFGENLKNLRLKNNLTQEKLAEKLDITYHHFNDIENYRKKPSFPLVELIIEFFQVAPEQMFTDKDKEITPESTQILTELQSEINFLIEKKKNKI